MTTLPERLEKRCLNCNALIHGRYCQICGQENVYHKMTFFGMIKHFVFDLLHFDGKFFTTILMLFRKPGIVARNYIEGKRRTYLEPFKMYIFTSTIMFLIFSVLNKLDHNLNKGAIEFDIYSKGAGSSSNDSMPTPMYYSTYQDFEKQIIKLTDKGVNPIERLFYKKMYSIGKEKQIRGNALVPAMVKDFFSSIPTILFFLLPVFAWLLHLLHLKRKDLLFSDHGIFSLYFFTTIYISILIVNFLVLILVKLLKFNSGGVIMNVCVLFLLVHFFIAIKRFYNQSFLRTLAKFLFMLFFGWIILFVSFFIFSLITFLFF